MNIEDLNAALGAYFRRYERVIAMSLTSGFASRATFTPIGGVTDQYVATVSHLEKVIQPYQRGFTPHAARLKASAEINQVRRAKIDYEIDSDDVEALEKSAMGYIIGNIATSSNPTAITPGVANMVMNSIIDRSDEEFEFKMSERGVFAAPTSPTPGEPEDVTDGIDKKIDDGIDAGKLIPFAMGDYGDADVLDYVEEFVKLLPESMKNKRVQIEASTWAHENYWLNRRTKFGGNVDYNPNAPLFVMNYPNITLVRVPGAASKKRIKCTIPGNKIMIENGTSEEKRLRYVYKEDERVIRIVADFKVGFGYRVMGLVGSTSLNEQFVFVNDVK